MLDAVRRWLTGGDSLPAWAEFGSWARAHGWAIKRAMTLDGWVMEDAVGHPGWRIEWGPAQRSFMSSHEFRIRVEFPDGPDIQALVLDRPLLARLDRELYQQITDTVRTRLDQETPEEMRWIAMLPKLAPNAMGVALRDRYGALSDEPGWLERWIAVSLAAALEAHAHVMPVEAVSAEPFILRVARGQMVIRQAAPRPRVEVLQACVGVAEAAAASVRPAAA